MTGTGWGIGCGTWMTGAYGCGVCSCAIGAGDGRPDAAARGASCSDPVGPVVALCETANGGSVLVMVPPGPTGAATAARPGAMIVLEA